MSECLRCGDVINHVLYFGRCKKCGLRYHIAMNKLDKLASYSYEFNKWILVPLGTLAVFSWEEV